MLYLVRPNYFHPIINAFHLLEICSIDPDIGNPGAIPGDFDVLFWYATVIVWLASY